MHGHLLAKSELRQVLTMAFYEPLALVMPAFVRIHLTAFSVRCLVLCGRVRNLEFVEGLKDIPMY